MQRKDRFYTGLTGRFQTPLHPLSQHVANGEPQSGSFLRFLGGIKRIEDIGQMIFRYPGTVVDALDG